MRTLVGALVVIGSRLDSPGVSPERPEADRVAEGGAEARRVGARDPYVVN